MVAYPIQTVKQSKAPKGAFLLLRTTFDGFFR
jgi:hypothetical protein